MLRKKMLEHGYCLFYCTGTEDRLMDEIEKRFDFIHLLAAVRKNTKQ